MIIYVVIKEASSNHYYEKVAEYQLRYKGQTNLLSSSDIADGKVTVELQPENAEIEARIRYEGFDSWSAWICSDQKVGREKLKIYSALNSYFCLGPGRKNRRKEKFENIHL